jgi:hypothetical protein
MLSHMLLNNSQTYILHWNLEASLITRLANLLLALVCICMEEFPKHIFLRNGVKNEFALGRHCRTANRLFFHTRWRHMN